MFLAHSQKSILEHKNPQCIGVQEKVMQNFTDIEQTKIRECLNVRNDELIYTSKAVYFEGQPYSAGEVVIISYEQDNHVFEKIRTVCFFKSDVFLVSDILNIIQFNTNFNAYSVEVTGQICIKKIGDLLDCHPLGFYEVNNAFFVNLKYYVRPGNDDE